MTYTKTLAEEHGLFAGQRVLVLTLERKDGTVQRELFRYDTAFEWARDAVARVGLSFSISFEPWDGIESVIFYNGD